MSKPIPLYIFVFILFGLFLSIILFKYDDKPIPDLILLWTAVVVLWYTTETYLLRQLSLDAELNEYMPILYPDEVGSAILQYQSVTGFIVNNVGKGTAKNIEFYIGKYKVYANVTIPNGDSTYLYVNEKMHEKIQDLINEKNKVIEARIEYKDIYDRQFVSQKIQFVIDEADPNTRYTLKKGSWDFRKK